MAEERLKAPDEDTEDSLPRARSLCHHTGDGGLPPCCCSSMKMTRDCRHEIDLSLIGVGVIAGRPSNQASGISADFLKADCPDIRKSHKQP